MNFLSVKSKKILRLPQTLLGTFSLCKQWEIWSFAHWTCWTTSSAKAANTKKLVEVLNIFITHIWLLNQRKHKKWNQQNSRCLDALKYFMKLHTNIPAIQHNRKDGRNQRKLLCLKMDIHV